MKIGYFSQSAFNVGPINLYGTEFKSYPGAVYSTPDGREVTVTEVRDEEKGPPDGWPDLVCVGPVVKWLRSVG